MTEEQSLYNLNWAKKFKDKKLKSALEHKEYGK